MLPEIPGVLSEAAAGALEWARLREYVAGKAQSALGRGWVMALEASGDAAWIDAQQQRTAEVREFLRGGGSFEFAGMFDPTELLEQARIEGTALEGVQLLALLGVVERLAAWRKELSVVRSPLSVEGNSAARGGWPGIAAMSAAVVAWDAGRVLAALGGKLEPDGSLSDEASGELRRIRRAMERQHRAIEESLRKSLRALATEGSAQDELITVRGERFVIPVKAEFRRRVPGVVHGSSSSGQTVFVEPLETIEQNNEMQRLLDEEQREVRRILVAMTRAVGAEAEAIAAGTAVLAEVESHFARAKFAEELGCVRPHFVPSSTHFVRAAGAPAGREERVEAEAERVDGLGQGGHLRGPSTSASATPALRMTGLLGAPALSLVQARHPLLEIRLRRSGAAGSPASALAGVKGAVPISLELREDARQLILSGPNTGGKTVALKTVGLLAVMAQAGLPVPAEEARLPLFDAVYADIGDAQSIESNLSSFSAHVKNVDRIARAAGPDSLVLLDELGSATDPEEGSALAVAVAEHFLRVRAWCCITTHLTSLKVYAAQPRRVSALGLSEKAEGNDRDSGLGEAQSRMTSGGGAPEVTGVLNAAVGFDQERMAPTYAVRMGVPGASAGLNIAERLGLVPEIVTAARTNMTTQAADIGALLDQLHAQLAAIADERAAMQIREGELARERTRLETEGRAEQKARTKELEVKLQALIGDFEWQVKEAVRAIDDKAAAKRIARDAGTAVARARREFSAQFTQTVLAHTTGADKTDAAAVRASAVKSVKVGDTVRLKSLGREARVERVIDAKNFEVAVGTMKMRVGMGDVAEVTPAVVAVTPLEAARRRGGVTVQMAPESETDHVPMEINVIGRTADEAHDEVARYLDRAFMAGLPRVRIVHGTGMGVLRRTLREYLKGHPNVAGVTEPEHHQGGQGATEVELRQ
jgi:DNA mismatch repair protein MutS2